MFAQWVVGKEDDGGDEAVEQENVSFVLTANSARKRVFIAYGMAWHEAMRCDAMRSGLLPGKRLGLPSIFGLSSAVACFDFVQRYPRREGVSVPVCGI